MGRENAARFINMLPGFSVHDSHAAPTSFLTACRPTTAASLSFQLLLANEDVKALWELFEPDPLKLTTLWLESTQNIYHQLLSFAVEVRRKGYIA